MIYGKIEIYLRRFDRPSFYTGFLENLPHDLIRIQTDNNEKLIFRKEQLEKVIEMERSDNGFFD